jgi:hypothetical protein
VVLCLQKNATKTLVIQKFLLSLQRQNFAILQTFAVIDNGEK